MAGGAPPPGRRSDRRGSVSPRRAGRVRGCRKGPKSAMLPADGGDRPRRGDRGTLTPWAAIRGSTATWGQCPGSPAARSEIAGEIAGDVEAGRQASLTGLPGATVGAESLARAREDRRSRRRRRSGGTVEPQGRSTMRDRINRPPEESPGAPAIAERGPPAGLRAGPAPRGWRRTPAVPGKEQAWSCGPRPGISAPLGSGSRPRGRRCRGSPRTVIGAAPV